MQATGAILVRSRWSKRSKAKSHVNLKKVNRPRRDANREQTTRRKDNVQIQYLVMLR
ncbi:MAG: hypothetical protein ACYCQI_05060 [Gammaproteobacteria bacterium]